MTEVIPAIIPESFEDLKDKMVQVRGLTKLVQVDVCDGKFVPSKCWPYIGDREDNFKKILNESEGFPFWEKMDFEADLMISEPEKGSAEDWIHAGAKRIILHIESSEKLLDFVKELRKKYGYPSESAVSVEIGIGIGIETPNEMLNIYLTPDETGKTLADFVQFMGIRKIGYQHQEFDEEVLNKIADLRKKYPELIISIDGGVSFDNASDLVDAGVNRLVSGSALYESEDMKEAIEELSGYQ
jgi:ribulose-phosphate 3-epimerase